MGSHKQVNEIQEQINFASKVIHTFLNFRKIQSLFTDEACNSSVPSF